MDTRNYLSAAYGSGSPDSLGSNYAQFFGSHKPTENDYEYATARIAMSDWLERFLVLGDSGLRVLIVPLENYPAGEQVTFEKRGAADNITNWPAFPRAGEAVKPRYPLSNRLPASFYGLRVLEEVATELLVAKLNEYSEEQQENLTQVHVHGRATPVHLPGKEDGKRVRHIKALHALVSAIAFAQTVYLGQQEANRATETKVGVVQGPRLQKIFVPKDTYLLKPEHYSGYFDDEANKGAVVIAATDGLPIFSVNGRAFESEKAFYEGLDPVMDNSVEQLSDGKLQLNLNAVYKVMQKARSDMNNRMLQALLAEVSDYAVFGAPNYAVDLHGAKYVPLPLPFVGSSWFGNFVGLKSDISDVSFGDPAVSLCQSPHDVAITEAKTPTAPTDEGITTSFAQALAESVHSYSVKQSGYFTPQPPGSPFQCPFSAGNLHKNKCVFGLISGYRVLLTMIPSVYEFYMAFSDNALLKDKQEKQMAHLHRLNVDPAYATERAAQLIYYDRRIKPYQVSGVHYSTDADELKTKRNSTLRLLNQCQEVYTALQERTGVYDLPMWIRLALVRSILAFEPNLSGPFVFDEEVRKLEGMLASPEYPEALYVDGGSYVRYSASLYARMAFLAKQLFEFRNQELHALEEVTGFAVHAFDNEAVYVGSGSVMYSPSQDFSFLDYIEFATVVNPAWVETSVNMVNMAGSARKTQPAVELLRSRYAHTLSHLKYTIADLAEHGFDSALVRIQSFDISSHGSVALTTHYPPLFGRKDLTSEEMRASVKKKGSGQYLPVVLPQRGRTESMLLDKLPCVMGSIIRPAAYTDAPPNPAQTP